MKNKLNPICANYRKKKLGTKTKNGSIVVGITFDSELKQAEKEKRWKNFIRLKITEKTAKNG